MQDSREWQKHYWQYLNEHDPVGRQKPAEDRGKRQNQIAQEAGEYANRKTRW